MRFFFVSSFSLNVKLFMEKSSTPLRIATFCCTTIQFDWLWCVFFFFFCFDIVSTHWYETVIMVTNCFYISYRIQTILTISKWFPSSNIQSKKIVPVHRYDILCYHYLKDIYVYIYMIFVVFLFEMFSLTKSIGN